MGISAELMMLSGCIAIGLWLDSIGPKDEDGEATLVMFLAKGRAGAGANAASRSAF